MTTFTRGAAFALFLLSAGAISLCAQTPAATPAPAPAAAPSHDAGVISFLTPEQQKQYAEARAKALTDNPALKSEGEALMQEFKQSVSTGAEPSQSLMNKMATHREKLRQAMLKEDSTLKPIFAEIDEHLVKMKLQQLGGVQNSGPKTAPSSH